MKNYAIRRVLQLIPVLLGISILIFAVMKMIPGDVISGILGVEATPELRAQLAAKYGLDRPYVIQYLDWIGGVLRGDFGESIRTSAPILPEILSRFKVTAELTIMAAVISWCIAIPLGVLAAVKRNTFADRFVRVFALLGVSVPGFALSILLPGLYVAVGSFHPELLPATILTSLVVSEETTPFPLMFEALAVFFIYEIVREAGLRMPQAVGHAVSIVGALVIGDAAVSAGIIGAPMVIVVAVTAISSFVVPSLYEPVTVLRFAFILICGLSGVFGVVLALCAVIVNLCAVNPLGVPATSPATPFSLYPMRDVLFRWGWRTLAKEDLRVQDLAGSDIRGEGTADDR